MDESANVTSICLSNDCRYALVNLSTEVKHKYHNISNSSLSS